MKIGDRVIHKDGSIGIVEGTDELERNLLADVRWLTPNNEPSCCVSLCMQEHLSIVPNHVVPMKRNKKWWAEANEFMSVITDAIKNAKF